MTSVCAVGERAPPHVCSRTDAGVAGMEINHDGDDGASRRGCRGRRRGHERSNVDVRGAKCGHVAFFASPLLQGYHIMWVAQLVEVPAFDGLSGACVSEAA